MKIGMVSLGCPKNLVDSEEMLGLLTRKGFEIVDDETLANVQIHYQNLLLCIHSLTPYSALFL